MNPVTLTIGIRGFCAIALIAGGLSALWWGFLLFRHGAAGEAKAKFKMVGLDASAQGVGAVVMVTAVAWAYGGIGMAPKLKTSASSAEVAEIYSLKTDQGLVTAPAIVGVASKDQKADSQFVWPSQGVDIMRYPVTPEAFRSNFKYSLKHALASTDKKETVTVHGQPATFDLSSVAFENDPEGQPVAFADLRSGEKMVKIAYTLQDRGYEMVFVPTTTNDAKSACTCAEPAKLKDARTPAQTK